MRTYVPNWACQKLARLYADRLECPSAAIGSSAQIVEAQEVSGAPPNITSERSIEEQKTSMPTTGRARLRPTWEERKNTVCKIIAELPLDADGRHASGKIILKELKSRNVGQRPAITWEILGELKKEGKYKNPY